MSTSHPSSDASRTETRPRSKSGVLSPPTSGTSSETNSGPNPRKRKRESSSTIEDLLRDNFTVKPHRSIVHSKSRSLQPILLLPRTELRLSYLDNGTSPSPLPQARFFESHIKILELEARMKGEPMVLLARLDDGKSLYAVERADSGLYVLCKLGSWVDLKTLEGDAVVSRLDNITKTSVIEGQGFAESSLITPESSKLNKKRKLAIEAIQTKMKRPPVQTQSSEVLQPDTPVAEHSSAAHAVSITPIAVEELDQDKPLPSLEVVESTPAELLDTIRTHYLEELYLSHGQLTRLPKSTLERARQVFRIDSDQTPNVQDLIAFLEGMVLTLDLMNEKFMNVLPELVKDMALDFQSGDEALKPKKKRQSKKIKPGKNGLYPCEADFIRKWLNGIMSHDHYSGILDASAIKTHVAELWIRETQLQLIILLELLALKSINIPTEVDVDLPSALPKGHKAKKKKPVKSQKAIDHENFRKCHINKLIFSQEPTSLSSLDLDEPSHKPKIPSGASAGTSKHEADADALREFCKQVIVIYFAPRLPEVCADINSRLGGLAEPPPEPPPQSKSLRATSASTGTFLPGAPAKRAALKKQPSIQRVRTDEGRARSNSRGAEFLARSVSRSSTNPPRSKRERSEAASLYNIPPKESQSSRGGTLNNRRYSQREVVFDQSSAKADLKSKKEAADAAKVKEAIGLVAKPNRELAGRTQVEAAEKRTAAISSKSGRKKNPPIRNTLHDVQIMSTPRNGRRKDMMPPPRPLSNNNVTPLKNTPSMLPPSSVGQVPDSLLRLRLPRPSAITTNSSSAAGHAHPSRKKNSFNVGETPSRPASRAKSWMSYSQTHEPDLPPSSPTLPRSSNSPNDDFHYVVPNSVVRNPFAPGPRNEAEGGEVIEATPTKPRHGRSQSRNLASFAPPGLSSFSQLRDSPDVSKSAHIASDGGEKENSLPLVKSGGGNGRADEGDDIYKALGWYDDDLDELG